MGGGCSEALTLVLFVGRVRVAHGDEDDKEEERPEELDDQLNLQGRKTHHVDLTRRLLLQPPLMFTSDG